MSIYDNHQDHRGAFSELDRELQIAIRYLIFLGAAVSAVLLIKVTLFL